MTNNKNPNERDTKQNNDHKKSMMPGMARIMLAGAVLLSGLVFAFAGVQEVEAAATKTTICHRTHSTTNPYRRITVANASITKNNGHGDEGASNTHNKGTGVFDPNFSYPPNAKLWNDIIPDETAGGSATIAYNFSGAGLAIYNGTSFDGVDYSGLCKKMTAKEFYDSEVAAGEDPADILLDLDEQEANEDEALKRALGGSFVGSDPSTYAALVSIDTTEPTDLADTSATLNGTITVGSTTTDTYFHWSTDPELDTYSTVAGVPGTITGTSAVEYGLTGLTACTTYYYRVVGVTDPGTASEWEMLGDIVSFTTSCATTTTTAEPTTTTAAPSTTEVGGGGGTSTTVSAGARVEGVVWIDNNRNAVQDPNEPGIPGIVVRLDRNSQVNAASIENEGVVALADASLSTITNAFGFYSFPSVQPGAWQIVAKLSTDKLEQTSDTGGINDWIVPVLVPVNGVGIGDFAAAGNKQLSGALETETGERITCGQAEITWSGIDGVLGTADDAVFQVKLNSKGEFLTDGVPGGPYRVSGNSCAGKQAAAKSIDLIADKANVKLVVSERIPVGGSERNRTLILIMTLIAVGGILYPRKRAQS